MKAWEQALAWAPRNVDAEMRATGQTVLRYEQEAAILRAQAEAAVDEAERARLVQEAEDKAALAATMREVEAGLAEVAEQRAAWLVETAQTKEIAERAKSALADRGWDIGAEPDRVTAEEWLELHRQAMAEDDAHREVTEVEDARVQMPARVPTPAEAAAAVVVARRAADEIADRRSVEAAHAAGEASQRAVEEQAAREAAWRDRDALQAERAAERSDALSL